LPARLRPEFSRAGQSPPDNSGRGATANHLCPLFRTASLAPGRAPGPVALESWSTGHDGEHGRDGSRGHDGERGDDGEHRRAAERRHRFTCVLSVDGRTAPAEGHGNGPLSALTDALARAGIAVDVLDFSEHSVATGSAGEAVAYASCRVGDRTAWGAGLDTSVLSASVQAVMSAVNRAYAR
ncbi:alpha-isopropylmalate synthase regulatory domain-containing protein, partial [Streptomyces sp. NPDC055912]|uniref:alpha-isopropylmalate synthase regulatory domain-containing protein n=1 Tax=Streptomyces sp. NPDC055912 TaxID=3345660 RepID=UPI0035DE7403